MKKSFTLLEMLIVLGIIAVILAALTISFSTTQKKTRDARRKSDLKSMQNALEQYYSTCGYVYPTSLEAPMDCSMRPEGFITQVPVDPKTATPYIYSPTGTGGGFSLCTDSLESEAPTGYCVVNQQ